MSFRILPAIDLRAGSVVRLRQGDYGEETRYADDPVRLAETYRDAGAEMLHVVDLDGARDGRSSQTVLIARLARVLPVQAGGGVRRTDDVRRLLDAGVVRVVVGSLAVREPERVLDWLARFGNETIVPALDTRRADGRWCLPVSGWTEESGAALEERVGVYARAGACHLLCTDIARDGTLGGINAELYAHLHRLAPELHVQASGGVRGLEDVRRARAAGAHALVLGRALLDGLVTLEEARAC